MNGQSGSQPQVYEIRFKGHLSSCRAQMFEGLEMVQGPGGETALTGPGAGEGTQNGVVTWEIASPTIRPPRPNCRATCWPERHSP